jgi:hypothetical protein
MRFATLVVEQLDRAATELAVAHPINARIALILVDNAAELIIHRNVAVRFYLYAPRARRGAITALKTSWLRWSNCSARWTGIATGFVDLCSPALLKTVALLAAVLYLRNPVQLAFIEHTPLNGGIPV